MASKDDTKKALKKVGDLVRRAQSPTGDDDEEARNAAIGALALMKEHELVVVPRSELDRVNEQLRSVNEKIQAVSKEANMKMLIAGIGGLMLGGGKLPKFG